MTEASINLTSSSKDSAQLSVVVGHEMNLQIYLTDFQVLYLARAAVMIIRERAKALDKNADLLLVELYKQLPKEQHK